MLFISCLIPFIVIFNSVRAVEECGKYHYISSGDYCYKIYSDNELTFDEFMALNPGLNCNNIYIGQRVCVVAQEKKESQCESVYRVKAGDSCYAIASKNQISIERFFELNKDIKCDSLQLNQKICVSSGNTNAGDLNSETNENTSPCKVVYKVKSGDSCYAIATKNKISIEQLFEANKELKCESLQFDQSICVPSEDSTVDLQTDEVEAEMLVTREEFENAIQAYGFPIPSEEKYENFVKLAGPKGGIKTKRELAMFLTHILWESGGLRFIKETFCMDDGCPDHYNTADDYPGQRYFGRGYIQLTWSYNYKAASLALFNDLRLYHDPELVAQDDSIAWAVSFWFWKENVHSVSAVQNGYFGASTRAINGALECTGPYQEKAHKRFELYKIILKEFSIEEAPIEGGCY